MASVEGTTTTFHHTDHLSGSSVESDEEGYVTEVLDYYPFGTTRIDQKYTTYENDKKFTGHEYDDATDLYYMGARYQNPEIGRFISEDPVYLGTGTQGSDENGQKQLRSYLSDPQGFNSYSYSRNNPLRYVDPNGEWFKEFFTGQQSWGSFQGELGEAAMYMSPAWQTAMDHPYVTGAAVGVGGGAAAYAGAAVITSLSVNYLGGLGTSCIAFCGKSSEVAQNISISAERLQHVLDRHGYNTIQKNVSTFNRGVNISKLIEQSSKINPSIQPNGNLERIFDAGKNIGIDRLTGNQTSITTVITNKANELITSFPGRPLIK